MLATLCEEYYNEEWDPSSYCLEQLGDKVGELDTIDHSRKELLDTALLKQCSNFQPASYAKLQVIILGIFLIVVESCVYR